MKTRICALPFAMAVAFATSIAPPSTGRAQAVAAPPDFNGVWRTMNPPAAPLQGSNLRWTPAPGELPPFNAEYRQKYEQTKKSREQGSEETEPVTRCLPPGMPYFTLAEYGLEIVQSTAKIAFFSQWMDAYRRVYLDRTAPPADYDPSYFGYSVGHWEGDTLIVETSRLRGDTVLDRYGSSHSDSMTITERFHLTTPDVLEDRLTVRDPKAFTKPWEFARTYKRAKRGDDELHENTCTEGLKF